MKKVPATIKFHQAETETGSGPADAATDTATDSKRKKVSSRDFLGTDGSVVKTIEEATGARYTLLGGSQGNRDFDQQFGDAGKLVTMCAIFGFHTKVGNVANTVLNDKDEPGTPDDAAKAIEEFIASANGGTWAERTTGGVGARIDKAALAASIYAVAGGDGKSPKTYDQILAKLEEDPVFVRQTRQVPAIAAEYATRVGKAPKSVDDVLKF